VRHLWGGIKRFDRLSNQKDKVKGISFFMSPFGGGLGEGVSITGGEPPPALRATSA